MNTDTPPFGAFLVSLGKAGVEVAAHPSVPDRIRHRPVTLPESIVSGLRTHRTSILALLHEGIRPLDEESAFAFAERMAVADGLEMPTHPGSAAWSIAIGETICCQVATRVVH